jgi:LPXTG-motif cell wall-anchored protein
MRAKMAAGVLVALTFLIPAAPAMAEAGEPGLDKACQTVERKVYKDIRTFVTVDLDTATDDEVLSLAEQILAEAKAESLPVLPDAVQKGLAGTAAELRTFLKADVYSAWSAALRISVVRTLVDTGPHVEAAAQKVLDQQDIDVYLVYLNEGLYAARALDCATKPTPTPTVTPSATTTVAPIPSASAGGGAPGADNGAGDGGLPITGTDTATMAGIGGALLFLGGAAYVIGRRRRSRFIA